MKDESAVLFERDLGEHVDGPDVLGHVRDARADGRDTEHRAQTLLRVAHGHEDTLALRGERESLGRADRRLADAALPGDDDEALVSERRHQRLGRDA